MTELPAASRPPVTVTRRLASANRILAVTHMNPDGDAVGSLVALGHVASKIGVDVRLYCETPIPAHLGWLNNPAPIIENLASLGDWKPDCVVFLDCADEHRAGEEMAWFIEDCRRKGALCGGETICIDHHMGNPDFADINWVDPTMSATGLMVALIAKELWLALSGDRGESVYRRFLIHIS